MAKLPKYLLFFVVILLAAAGVAFVLSRPRPVAPPAETFAGVMIAGKNAFEGGNAAAAVTHFSKAVQLEPTQPEAHLNLANAYLFAGDTVKTIAHGEEVLRMNKDSAAALYVIGCAQLREGNAEAALKALQQSRFIQPGVSAVSFQIGGAHMKLGQSDAAVAAFRETIALEPQHPAAHYALSQALMRVKDTTAAQAELATHQAIVAARKSIVNDPTFFEKCVHTRAVLPTVGPEYPDPTGIHVTFEDATQQAFGDDPDLYRTPAAIVDVARDARPSVFATERGKGFRLLANSEGTFRRHGDPIPGLPEGAWGRAAVGDINNDRVDDVVIVSPSGGRTIRIDKDGQLTDTSAKSGADALLRADEVLLADVDFTGKLGVITAGSKGVTFLRNQGPGTFTDVTQGLAMPELATATRQITMDDWNGDDLPDLFFTAEGGRPRLLLNQHGGKFTLSGPDAVQLTPTTDVAAGARGGTGQWPTGTSIVVGDIDGDLTNDLVLATETGLQIVFGGRTEQTTVAASGVVAPAATRLYLIDYDNDGWLDLFASGSALRAWRNLGRGNFREESARLGIDKLAGPIELIGATDFDADGDSDLLLSAGPNGALRLLRCNGAHTNVQLRVELNTKRSNSSGLGTRIELVSGGWRASRTVKSLPVDIGLGRRTRIESVSVHWADLLTNHGAAETDRRLVLNEPEFPTGSCPYLYVWDGSRFRYVTDLLGASPAGLRVTDDHFIDADTDELVGIGDETNVQPREGSYVLQVTDELRELLYFDEVALVVADRPADMEVHTTSKLRPGMPFVPHELVAVSGRIPLQSAIRNDGLDATKLLAEIDGVRMSPIKLRPQLRSLAEPIRVVLDFGPLDVEKPLVLAMTGWLRFGGGMANVGASHDPALPFPFPVLEAETGEREWQKVDVVVGAPAGKTKSITVDLTGKLSAGTRRLRWSTAFEIHLDRIALFSRDDMKKVQVTRLTAASADLHYRGSGEYEDRPWDEPITPNYDRLQPRAPWLVTPTGWCTRYGDVRELLTKKDNALVIMNCGDETTVKFAADQLPPKPPGHVREFFIFTSGWDKDSDFHVEAGLTVEPIPWHGMDDQRYGKEPRPEIDGDWWIPKYNTRWIGPMTLGRRQPREP